MGAQWKAKHKDLAANAKGRLFGKLVKDIMIAARDGADPNANARLRLLFLSCGTEDPRYPGQLRLHQTLQRHGIRHEWRTFPGAHEWKVWRHSLAALLPRLFQPARSP